MPSGDLVYELKSPWSDGTSSIQLSHAELFEKVCALVPLPYSHTSRYFGVLSSHSQWRDKVVLKPNIHRGFVASSAGDPEKMTWAKLLARTFKIDITRCPNCCHRVYPDHRTVVEEQPEIRMILMLLGLDPDPPPIRPARRGFFINEEPELLEYTYERDA